MLAPLVLRWPLDNWFLAWSPAGVPRWAVRGPDRGTHPLRLRRQGTGPASHARGPVHARGPPQSPLSEAVAVRAVQGCDGAPRRDLGSILRSRPGAAKEPEGGRASGQSRPVNHFDRKGVLMPAIEEAASAFLANKRVAVIGVSRHPQDHGSNARLPLVVVSVPNPRSLSRTRDQACVDASWAWHRQRL